MSQTYFGLLKMHLISFLLQKYCLGSKPRHKIFNEYVMQFYDMYPEIPKFTFMFHSEYSHATTNYAKNADKDVLQMLKVCVVIL